MDAAGSLELGVASGAEFVLERWSKIDKSTIRSFKDDDGIVNDVASYTVCVTHSLFTTPSSSSWHHTPHMKAITSSSSHKPATSRMTMGRWTHIAWEFGRQSE